EILAQFPPGKEAGGREGARELGTGSGPADDGTFRKPAAGEQEEEEEEEVVEEMGNRPQALTGISTPQEEPKSSATSATMELDKLMASLSDFQLHSQVSAQPSSSSCSDRTGRRGDGA
ncbi:hypothetical protein chiPu_0031382, partial [Chiloscyllium punctatum]|nr:hypothetical protein [Chiloscyllium punctatum]